MSVSARERPKPVGGTRAARQRHSRSRRERTGTGAGPGTRCRRWADVMRECRRRTVETTDAPSRLGFYGRISEQENGHG